MSGGYTLGEIYRKGAKFLEDAGVEDAAYDSLCLMEHFFSVNRTDLIMNGSKAADASKCESFLSAAAERAGGKPLQYILGMWSFMGFDFYVGEGVLIPRDDTEVVVGLALDYLNSLKNPKIIDLCSGSGAIAIAIAKNFLDSEVTALELSDTAIEYLYKNIKLNEADNVTVVKGDVTAASACFSDGEFDLIISNPPYIESDEIDILQRELQYEPRMALDGGADGLYFYRIITEKWASKVKKGGMLAYEVGEEQYEPVSEMLKANGFEHVSYRPDLQGYKRTVSGIKR